MESAAKQATERVREQGGKMKAELGGVVVLDFGGQYTQLIARRIREQQVFSAVLPCTCSIAEIRKLAPAGIVLSGGPSSVYDADAPKCDQKVLALGIPVLGICYGQQLMAHLLGNLIERLKQQLHLTSIVVTHDMRLAKKLADRVVFLNAGKAIFFGTMEEMERSSDPVLQEFLALDELVVPA